MSAKKYGKELSLQFYRDMKRAREFDEKTCELFVQGKLAGNLHTLIGQEAIAIGVHALKSTDFLVPSHRGNGQSIIKGADANSLMAEFVGKATGCCKGKGGSMHIGYVSKRILPPNGIVGAGIPIATGSALASKIMKKDEVTLVYFGDGASNTGEFHEALNMASAWKLPAVYFCENNKYGVSVCIDRVCNVEDIALRANAYGIPGIVVDGNDAFQVYEAVKIAVERARNGEGPTLIEGKTYRYHGHFEGDPQIYKTKEEMEEWLKRDAIERLRKDILDSKLATPEELNRIDEEVKTEMEEAAEFALQSPFPELEELITDVYSVDNERCVIR